MVDDGRTLRRDLTRLRADLKALMAVVTRQGTHIGEIAAALPVIGAQSERFGQLIEPLATGFTTIEAVWPNPFPDTAYMLIPTVVAPTANVGQVFWQAGAKLTTGCTVVIRNTSGVAIPTAILDVLGIRT